MGAGEQPGPAQPSPETEGRGGGVRPDASPSTGGPDTKMEGMWGVCQAQPNPETAVERLGGRAWPQSGGREVGSPGPAPQWSGGKGEQPPLSLRAGGGSGIRPKVTEGVGE